MIRSGGGLIMVFARVNNILIQQLFPLDVGPHKSMVNGCCKTTFCGGGGGGGVCGGGGGGGGGYVSVVCRYGSLILCLHRKCLIMASFLEYFMWHSGQVVKSILSGEITQEE